ncbi:O-acyltransferase like protein-like [Hyposmocoma kahamanoa]|uniref:O-acyltransferase like protein-like n=1 Tax=Hyposmocoma kahamanoa TaxID=1477025 RepID=UPI000E6D691E|nr:O-acyltransferase like protein-like [Hyposmocoma kahamanoa]
MCMNFTNGHLELDWEPKNPPFDSQFYEDLLNPELCQKQLLYILANDPSLLTQFIDSGLRIPRGITLGNLEDWGNYHQCLGIRKETDDSTIEGKFCFIDVPAGENNQLAVPELPDWADFNPIKLKVNNDTVKDIKRYNEDIKAMFGSKESSKTVDQNSTMAFKLAVCVPKPCTTQEVMDGIYGFTGIYFQYNDRYCRVKHDKLWAPADYVMISIFSLLGLLTLLSTSYDIWESIYLKPVTTLLIIKPKLFSVYTNTRQLLTFTSNSDTVECLDGIRSISIMWIIIGHTFFLMPQKQNLLYYLNYTLSINSLWITAAPMAMDTLFMLSGLLLVYKTANNMTGMKLLRSLHVFYLNRLLKLFPLLATAVLFQASIFHWISDGPVWDAVANATQNCRLYWWTTLLYVQNYINGVGNGLCLGHTWYLAVDMQMYLLSPLLLFWVLGRRKTTAWISLSCALIAIITSCTIYVFINKFPSSLFTVNDGITNPTYVQLYYYNTLTRGAAFVVGMLFGYLLHVYRGKQMRISKGIAVLTWIAALAIIATIVYSHHPMKSTKWDNRPVDGLINAFCRPLWTFSLGCMIFACHFGYGGPINWILSLRMWKLPSRLSYAMYLFHVPIILIVANSGVAPIYFSVSSTIYRFFSDLFVVFLVSFIMAVFVDSPFRNLMKLTLGRGPRKPKVLKQDNAMPKQKLARLNGSRTPQELKQGHPLPQQNLARLNGQRTPQELKKDNVGTKQNSTRLNGSKNAKNDNNENTFWGVGVVNNRFLKNNEDYY